MDQSFAEELYSSSLRVPKADGVSTSTVNVKCDASDRDDIWDEDGSLWDDSDERLDSSADLDREWMRRRDQFFTIGYRDGLIAGKEASAQEGFNIGFKHSVLTGFNWGLVRGVTSALAFLPDEMKEKIVETQENREKFQHLYESTHSLSTSDAVKLFSEDISSSKTNRPGEDAEASLHQGSLQDNGLIRGHIGGYIGKLKSLLLESPAIEIHLDTSAAAP